MYLTVWQCLEHLKNSSALRGLRPLLKISSKSQREQRVAYKDKLTHHSDILDKTLEMSKQASRRQALRESSLSLRSST